MATSPVGHLDPQDDEFSATTTAAPAGDPDARGKCTAGGRDGDQASVVAGGFGAYLVWTVPGAR